MRDRTKSILAIIFISLLALGLFEFAFYPGPIGVVRSSYIASVTGDNYNISFYNSHLTNLSLTQRERITKTVFSENVSGSENGTARLTLTVRHFLSGSKAEGYFESSYLYLQGNVSKNISSSSSGGITYNYSDSGGLSTNSTKFSYISGYYGPYFITMEQSYTSGSPISRSQFVSLLKNQVSLINEEDLLF